MICLTHIFQRAKNISFKYNVQHIRNNIYLVVCVCLLLNETALSDHPGGVYIVRFFRAWQEDSYIYVQIEFVERGTIEDLINSLVKEQRTVPDSTLWVMLHDVAAGTL